MFQRSTLLKDEQQVGDSVTLLMSVCPLATSHTTHMNCSSVTKLHPLSHWGCILCNPILQYTRLSCPHMNTTL